MAMHYRPGRTLLTAVGLTCLLLQAQGAFGQTPVTEAPPTKEKKAAPVVVVNPAPIPVTGTVSIGGTPAVTVNNSDAAPVPVRDVGRVAKERFQMSTVSTFFPTSFAATEVVTVPAGKRLVIEYASAWINAGGAGGLLAANLSSGVGVTNTLACLAQGQNALNFIFSCAGPVTQYVEPGATLNFNFQTFANSGGFYRVFVSGYYEPVP
jgi:hypothetical protein